jgi:hypothetical protein
MEYLLVYDMDTGMKDEHVCDVRSRGADALVFRPFNVINLILVRERLSAGVGQVCDTREPNVLTRRQK